jgi:hypothetical protein
MELPALASKRIEGERAPISELYKYATKTDILVLIVPLYSLQSLEQHSLSL